MAQIDLPLILHEDGTYSVINERADVWFFKIDELPKVNTKTHIPLGEILSQINVSKKTDVDEDSNEGSDEEGGLMFRTDMSEYDTEDAESDDDDNTTEPDLDLEPEIDMESDTEEQYINIPIRDKKPKLTTRSKTFKSRKTNARDYTRKLYYEYT